MLGTLQHGLVRLQLEPQSKSEPYTPTKPYTPKWAGCPHFQSESETYTPAASLCHFSALFLQRYPPPGKWIVT